MSIISAIIMVVRQSDRIMLVVVAAMSATRRMVTGPFFAMRPPPVDTKAIVMGILATLVIALFIGPAVAVAIAVMTIITVAAIIVVAIAPNGIRVGASKTVDLHS
ncbi:MAG: hypothetical protein DRQ52_09250 [Gammaproteobacteria bacterium]|nr:MAG: hypothetical protein DRQ52_09250 [Gammaproteobacteria bacterium]